MRYVCDTPLYRFPAWSGGKTRLDDLVEHFDAYDYILKKPTCMVMELSALILS